MEGADAPSAAVSAASWSATVLSSRPFHQLLARLGDQHEADVQALEAENGRLREEVAELRRAGPPRHHAACGAPEPEAPKRPVLAGLGRGELGCRAAAGEAGQPCRPGAALPAPRGAQEPESLLEPVLPSVGSGGSGWRTWADDIVDLTQDAKSSTVSSHWAVVPPVLPRACASSKASSASCERRTPGRCSSVASLLWRDRSDDSCGEVVDLSGPAGVGRRSVRVPLWELNRFCEMFEVSTLETSEATISVEKLTQVLQERGMSNVTAARVSSVLLQLEGVVARSIWPSKSAMSKSGIVEDLPHASFADLGLNVSFTRLVAVLIAKDIDTGLDAVVAKEVELWRQALTMDIDEVIARVSGEKKVDDETRLSSILSDASVTDDNDAWVPWRWSRRAKLSVLNIAVALSVVVSLISMSLNMDFYPRSSMWLIIEVASAAVFLADLLIKWRLLGCQDFLLGPDCWWHFSDALITIVQIMDVMLSVLMDGDTETFSLGNLALCLKVARVLRFARLIKTMRSSLGRELANMLSGLMIGMPALLWVLVLIFFGLWMIASFARYVIGPSPGEDLMEMCGFGGDDWNTTIYERRVDAGMPECERHSLYAEEFCPNVPSCMFSVFRCVIGDCTSRTGQSLPAHFTSPNGFGYWFAIFYFAIMVIIIFGLFNIITAVFVESTMKNMTADEVRAKQRTTYKARHVRKNLEELVRRIWDIQEGAGDDAAAKRLFRRSTLRRACQGPRSGSSWGSAVWTKKGGEQEQKEWTLNDASRISLSESAFYKILQDGKVQRILQCLDIDVSTSTAGIFGIFKLDDQGRVSIPELLGTLMKLRGGTSKADLIAPSVLISWLADEIQDTQKMVQALLDNQQAVPGAARPTIRRGGCRGGSLG